MTNTTYYYVKELLRYSIRPTLSPGRPYMIQYVIIDSLTGLISFSLCPQFPLNCVYTIAN